MRKHRSWWLRSVSQARPRRQPVSSRTPTTPSDPLWLPSTLHRSTPPSRSARWTSETGCSPVRPRSSHGTSHCRTLASSTARAMTKPEPTPDRYTRLGLQSPTRPGLPRSTTTSRSLCSTASATCWGTPDQHGRSAAYGCDVREKPTLGSLLMTRTRQGRTGSDAGVGRDLCQQQKIKTTRGA
jgi:hypothetical protein